MSFLRGIVLAFLPQRYWGEWSPGPTVAFRRAVLLSGLLQFFGVGFVLLRRYGAFLTERGRELSEQFGMGPAVLGLVTAEFLVRPLSWVLIYFTLEGGVRLLAAFITEETYPTLPLYLMARWQQSREEMRAEQALGPLVMDRVDRGDGTKSDWRIASCRPKPKWDDLMTVVYQDEHYEVAGYEKGAPPRPHIYLLRKIPEGKIIRSLHPYRPDEVLRR